jgi:hypothetical protein
MERLIVLGFWFSLHLEILDVVQYFTNLNDSLEQLVTVALLPCRRKSIFKKEMVSAAKRLFTESVTEKEEDEEDNSSSNSR